MTWKMSIFRSNPKLNTSMNFDTIEEAQDFGRTYDENVVIIENIKTGQWAKKERFSTEFCCLEWSRGNTKARSEQIQKAASSALEAAGGCVWFDKLMTTPEARWQELQKMYTAIIAATGCHRDTAKRHVAKALRRARYGEMVKHGGARLGSGAPVGNRNAARPAKKITVRVKKVL